MRKSTISRWTVKPEAEGVWRRFSCHTLALPAETVVIAGAWWYRDRGRGPLSGPDRSYRGAVCTGTEGVLASARRMSDRTARDLASTAREFLDAARRTITLPGSGIEIALLDWGGDGPLALLHHANGFCKGTWGLVAAALRHRYRVIAMDARGHGDSSKPTGADAYAWERFVEDAESVATRLASAHRDRRVALGLGNSFGGTALLGAAARRPHLFDRLVLVDPVTPPPPDVPRTPEHAVRMLSLVDGARKRRAHWPSRAAARAHWSKRTLFARWHPRALDLYALDGLREAADGSVALKCPGEVEAATFAGSGAIDVFAIARRVMTKTLFLWAAEGDFPRPVYEMIAGSMTDARVETVPAGHLMPMERPDLVIEAVERFIAEDRA